MRINFNISSLDANITGFNLIWIVLNCHVSLCLCRFLFHMRLKDTLEILYNHTIVIIQYIYKFPNDLSNKYNQYNQFWINVSLLFFQCILKEISTKCILSYFCQKELYMYILLCLKNIYKTCNVRKWWKCLMEYIMYLNSKYSLRVVK